MLIINIVFVKNFQHHLRMAFVNGGLYSFGRLLVNVIAVFLLNLMQNSFFIKFSLQLFLNISSFSLQCLKRYCWGKKCVFWSLATLNFINEFRNLSFKWNLFIIIYILLLTHSFNLFSCRNIVYSCHFQFSYLLKLS